MSKMCVKSVTSKSTLKKPQSKFSFMGFSSRLARRIVSRANELKKNVEEGSGVSRRICTRCCTLLMTKDLLYEYERYFFGGS